MESGAEEEAREALEKAWAVAPSDEQRVEADERLLALLIVKQLTLRAFG
jgi:tellurite resistance protein